MGYNSALGQIRNTNTSDMHAQPIQSVRTKIRESSWADVTGVDIEHT